MNQKLLTIFLVAQVLGLTYFIGYFSGLSSGRTEASEKYSIVISEHQEALNRQTDTLNAALKIEATDLSKEVNQLLKDTQAIKQQLKAQPQPLVVIKDGKCAAEEQLLEARRKMIERVNQ